MKKTLIALAAVAATGAAFAQSTVTISGGLNAGYGSTTRSGSTGLLSQVETAYALTSNQVAANHITFSGTEDLGGGLKASFSINQRFNPATGQNISNGSGLPAVTCNPITVTDVEKFVTDFEASEDGTASYTPSCAMDANGNDAFAQNVSIALSGAFGEVKAGRFTGVVAGPLGGYDPFGTDNNGIAMTFPQTRNNGMIAYTSPSFGGLKVAVQATLKNNNTTTTNTGAGVFAKNGTEVAVTYAAGPLSAMYGYTKHGISVNGEQPVTNTVGAAYNFGVARVSFMYGDTSAFERQETAIGVSAPMGAVTLKGGYLRQDNNGTVKNRVALGANYALSKRTTLMADMNKDTGVDAVFYFGARHSF
jgi:predicted porin